MAPARRSSASADAAPDLAAVRRAAGRIAGAVLRTPTIAAPALGAALGLDVVLKLEILQRTGSFKERGALNKLLSLTHAQAAAGVIAASAGNHAQGLAFHAQRLGVPATIVMPEATPFVKVERTAAFGARILLTGADFSATEQAAAERAELEVILGYLPKQADEATVREWVKAAIAETGAKSGKDVGKVMGAVMKAHKGDVDGNEARRIAAELLPG